MMFLLLHIYCKKTEKNIICVLNKKIYKMNSKQQEQNKDGKLAEHLNCIKLIEHTQNTIDTDEINCIKTCVNLCFEDYEQIQKPLEIVETVNNNGFINNVNQSVNRSEQFINFNELYDNNGNLLIYYATHNDCGLDDVPQVSFIQSNMKYIKHKKQKIF